MKKLKLLNAQLSGVIATLGHGQSLTIADCGLPIDKAVERIDLALCQGVPGFLQTLDVVLSEQQVEEIIIAEELATVSPDVHAQLMERIARLEQEQERPVNVIVVSHAHFKALTNDSAAIVRTGECTPYANIILRSGVCF